MNRSKTKGTRWETAIAEYLAAHTTAPVERRAQKGAKDRGDIAGIIGVVIEAKDDPGLSLQAGLRETEAERVNDGADIGVLWTKTRGKASAGDGIVHMTPSMLLWMLAELGYVVLSATPDRH
jgi:hypothetical protein